MSNELPMLRDDRPWDHPGYEAFCRQVRGRDYNEEQLNSAWESFKLGWDGDECGVTYAAAVQRLARLVVTSASGGDELQDARAIQSLIEVRLAGDLTEAVARLRGRPCARKASPHLSRHLTLGERRRIAHALRQLAEAAWYASGYAPTEMSAAEAVKRRELIRAEARDHDRLAGEVERNGLRFDDPALDASASLNPKENDR